MNSENIRQSLDSIKNQLTPILNEFSEYYVLHNKDPDNSEYESYYETSVNNIEKNKNKLFEIKKTIQYNDQQLSDNLKTINSKISNARNSNKILSNGLYATEDEYNTSEEMINNYVEIYNLTYLKNFSMLAGIIGLGFIMTKHFTNPQN